MLVRTWNVFHGNTKPTSRRAFLEASPAAADTDGSFKGIPVAFMEFWLAQVTEMPVAIASLAGKARQGPAPKTMQPVARRPVAEHRPEQAKPEPDSAKRLLGLEAAALRWDPLAQAFVAPVR